MALGNIAAGMPWPVFACGDNKQPVVSTGFKAATRERSAILQQFRLPGAMMIGVPTGAASGLVVIDVDIKDGHDGRPWLDENAEALPPTRTHKTKSGGLHLLFLRPDGYEIRNSASKIAPGIDVRGEGGYIIVPPSPGYAVADTTEPADMPLWLIRACMRQEQPAAPPHRAQERHERYTQAAIDGEVAAVMRAANGTRNDTLNKAAVKLGSLVAAQQMTRGVAEAELQHAGQAAGLDASECAKTIKSGLDFGVQHPRTMPAPKLNGHHRPPISEPPPDIDDPGYHAALERDMGMSPQEWDEIVFRESGHAIPAGPETAKGAALLWAITDPWNASDIPVRPWLAKGYLLRGAITVVSGPGSAGKSSLMVAWSVAGVIGSAFHRMRPVNELRIATYNVEDDENEQKRRFSGMLKQLEIKPDAFAGRLAILGPNQIGTLLHIPRDGRMLVNTPVMDHLETFVADFKPDVLILDPFVELHSVEENDNTAIRAVMARLRSMAAEHQMSIVVLHHSRKGNGDPGDPDTLRGASSIVGAARVVLTLNTMSEDEAKAMRIAKDKRRNYFRLDGAKNNYAPIEEAEWFERREIALPNGDGVAVAWPWKPPSVWAETNSQDLNKVLDRIAAGPEPSVLYTATRQGNSDRWVGQVLIDMTGVNDEQAKTMVKAWLKSGLLFEDDYIHPSWRRSTKGVYVNDTKRPS